MPSRTPSTAPDPALDTLLAAVGRHDAQAFAALYDELAPRIHGMVLRVLRDPHQSEEVTQEVLLELWRAASRFDPDRGSALAWVMTIAHRRAVDRVRASDAGRRRDDAAHAESSLETAYDATATAVESSLAARAVQVALAELSTIQRQAIELAYFGGHTHVEVSGLLGIPLGTAKSRIRDGLLRMRDLLTLAVTEPA